MKIDGTAVPGVEGAVSVNGYSVTIEKTDTQADIYQKLREAAEVGGAKLEQNENGTLSFKTAAYGKDAEIVLGFSDTVIADALGFTSVNLDAESGLYETVLSKGTDAEVELVRDTDDSEFSNAATVKVDGNRVTISDNGDFEMSFLIDENYAGIVDFEVTDIGTMTVHIGANMNQNMVISVPEVSAESLYIDDIDVTIMGGAGAAITRLDEAIAAVSSARSKLGAYENRLDYSVASLDSFGENMTEAQSRLADTDMAQEMTNYTQQNLLNQAAISVLAQANDIPQQVLQLLQ